MENNKIKKFIEEFEKENPDIIEALEIFKLSSQEYLEALEAIYGAKKVTLSSTNNIEES